MSQKNYCWRLLFVRVTRRNYHKSIISSRIKAELSRRWQWSENVDRLPEMLAEERRKDQEQILKRYKELNPDVEPEGGMDNTTDRAV